MQMQRAKKANALSAAAVTVMAATAVNAMGIGQNAPNARQSKRQK
jgi:hypothetical protein